MIGIIGARQIVEWDLLTSSGSPLGWKGSRYSQTPVASAGLSLFCKFPEFNLFVLALRHRAAGAYLDFSRRPVHANVRWFQDAVVGAAEAAHVDVRTWNYEDLFFDISKESGPVLMTNHVGNDQAQRLLERRRDRSIVSGPSDFPHLPIYWEKARTYAHWFGASGPEWNKFTASSERGSSSHHD